MTSPWEQGHQKVNSTYIDLKLTIAKACIESGLRTTDVLCALAICYATLGMTQMLPGADIEETIDALMGGVKNAIDYERETIGKRLNDEP